MPQEKIANENKNKDRLPKRSFMCIMKICKDSIIVSVYMNVWKKTEPVAKSAEIGDNYKDPLVFEQLFDLYAEKLYRYALLHTRTREDAEDVVSNTFVRLWKYINENKDNKEVAIKYIAALLYKIARNLIIDQYRKRKPSVSLDDLLEQGVELPDAAHLNHETKMDVSLVLKKCERLPVEDQDLLILRFVQDVPIKEIAVIYQITENNASVRIHRALNRLKNLYG